MDDLTHIARQSNMIKKKTTKGRQKIDLSKKIENPNSLQVAYCKRRDGLFKKAYELCALSGAHVAIVARSPGGSRMYTFGDPNVDLVIHHYIQNNNTKEDDQTFPCSSSYQDYCLEEEENNLMWFEEAIEGIHDLKELENYLHPLLEFKNRVMTRADEINNTINPTLFMGFH